MNIKEFLDSDPGWRAGRILDVRPAEAFFSAHLQGSVPWPLDNSCPAAEVPSLILPPRHECLLVVGDGDQDCAGLARELESRGRVAVTALNLAGGSLAGLPADLVEHGPARGHLWAPPAWLTANWQWLPPPALGPVLDLGCGSGRAAVFLAERGYRVTGLDRQPEALSMGRWLAGNRGVTCEFVPADLRQTEVVPSGPWAIILNFRYLQRDLLALFPRLLVAGGVALVRTFRQVPGYQGHPHPRHRLAANELLRSFPRASFDILAHEESFDPDGRPSAGIVARRR